MAFVNDIRHGRYCVFQMHVHLVFLTKYRTKGCDGAAIHSLRLILGEGWCRLRGSALWRDGGRGRPGASANPLPAQTLGIGNG